MNKKIILLICALLTCSSTAFATPSLEQLQQAQQTNPYVIVKGININVMLNTKSIAFNPCSLAALNQFLNIFKMIPQAQTLNHVTSLYFFGDTTLDFSDPSKIEDYKNFIATLKAALQRFPNLETLHISYMPIAAGFDELFNGVSLPNLRIAKFNHVSQGSPATPLSDDFKDALTGLDPDDSVLDTSFATPTVQDMMLLHLRSFSWFNQLNWLELKDNGIGHNGAYSLLGNENPSNLVHLNLSENKLDDDALDAMADSKKTFPHILSVDLSNNCINRSTAPHPMIILEGNPGFEAYRTRAEAAQIRAEQNVFEENYRNRFKRKRDEPQNLNDSFSVGDDIPSEEELRKRAKTSIATYRAKRSKPSSPAPEQKICPKSPRKERVMRNNPVDLYCYEVLDFDALGL